MSGTTDNLNLPSVGQSKNLGSEIIAKNIMFLFLLLLNLVMFRPLCIKYKFKVNLILLEVQDI